MLDLSDKDLIRACHSTLHALYRSERRRFIRLFLQKKELEGTGIDVEPLIRARLVERTATGIRATLRVFPVKGRYIVTDYHSSGKPDKVFPIQVDESAYFAQNLEAREGDLVLDVFTGSGIYPIFCAPKAERVYAVDVSDRALNFARFNSILNGVDSKIELLKGDGFGPVPRRDFDLITAAPPYVPSPPDCHGEMLAEASGWDGLKYPLEFLAHADEYLGDHGRIRLYVASVGDRRRSFLDGYLADTFCEKRFEITVDMLCDRPIRLDTLIAKRLADSAASGLTMDAAELEPWRQRLRDEGFSHFYYLLVTIQRGARFAMTKRDHLAKTRKDLYLVSDPEHQSEDYISKLLREYCD